MAPGLIEKWPDIDPATVAPLREGKPDMLNHQATRYVSKIEAQARGWKHFYTGERCNYGHRAARYVSNVSVCTDCQRVERGQLPIYLGGVPERDAPGRRLARPAARVAAVPVGPAQPSAPEKLFLTKYAELKDFGKAAEACGRLEAEFQAIMSWNEPFRESVHRLEEQLGIARTQEISEFFEWDEAKRRALCNVYANTADMKVAQRAIGVTNVQFHKEMTENPEFAEQFASAEHISRTIYDQVASALAARGDAKMLSPIVGNFYPEKHGAVTKMDLKVTQQLTLDQAHAQLATLLSRFDRQGRLPAPARGNGTVTDGEFEVVEPADDPEGAGNSDPDGSGGGSDPNSDLV